MLAWFPPPAPLVPAAEETPAQTRARLEADRETLLHVRAGAFRLAEILTALVAQPKSGKVSQRRGRAKG